MCETRDGRYRTTAIRTIIGAVYPFMVAHTPRKGKENMKTPKARRLPSGQWFCRVRIDGQDIGITKPTEKEAVAEAMAIKAGIIKKRHTERSGDLTLLQAIDAYIEDHRSVLSPSTIRGYYTIRNNRFQSAANTKISKITPERWQQLVSLEARQVSAKTLQNSWRFIKSVIRYATGESVSVRLPQVIQKNTVFLEPDEIPVFLSAIRGDKAEIIALLALSSLRRSEIQALTWKDIDLKKRLLKVNGSVVPNEENKYVHKKETKNQSSRRTVPIISPLANALEAVPNKSGPIATMHMSTAFNRINKVCTKNGLPPLGLHGLRHSFASLAYHLRIPEKIAMEIGGWSNEATMKKIYTHIAQSDREYYTSAFTSFFENGNESGNGN